MAASQRDRIQVIEAVRDRKMKQAVAAGRLGLSVRQIKRLVRTYRIHGAQGLTSKRGRPRRIPSDNAALPVSDGAGDRLVTRAAGDLEPAHAGARWSEPFITTSITEILPDGPRYRGRSAVELARAGCSFEAVAHLLWAGSMPDEQLRWNYRPPALNPDRLAAALKLPLPPEDVLKLFSTVVLALGLPNIGLNEFNEGSTLAGAQQVILVLAGCCGFLSKRGRFVPPEPGESTARVLARALGTANHDRAARLINEALILCADLELAPGTFAARIAASVGADLYACLAIGISAHAGALTGRGKDKAEEILWQTTKATVRRELDLLRGNGRKLYGFNHYLYPKGDPRAYGLLELARQVRPLPPAAANALWFIEQAGTQAEAYPGMAIGLVILAMALGLPKNAALAIRAISRIAGQAAHVQEQRMQGFQIRPRARYLPVHMPAPLI